MRNFLPMQSHQIAKIRTTLSRRRSIWSAKNFLKNNEILNRIEINGENNCFFTLRDHKDNFSNNPRVRLIYPTKNELARVSKVILDKINLAIREHFSFNQWKNTQNVIDWYNKTKKKFINL